jgi:chromate reductase, NAD(P)H dehydrogenase (quinone)
MRLLGIVGSLRADSYNAMLMRAAGEHLPPGVELVVFDGAVLRDIPAYDEDLDDMPSEAVEDLKAAIAEADGVLFATPEYNGSVPGFLKNALDWVSRPFEHNPLRNKPVAVISASTGMFGAVWASAELRKVLGLIGARALDRDTPVGLAKTAFDEEGRLIGPESIEAVEAAVSSLAEMIRERQALLAENAAR